MTQKMQNYLDSLNQTDAMNFFKDGKDKDAFMAESVEFFTALWDRMLELLKEYENK